jgi:hypothetical protein
MMMEQNKEKMVVDYVFGGCETGFFQSLNFETRQSSQLTSSSCTTPGGQTACVLETWKRQKRCSRAVTGDGPDETAARMC